MRRVDDLLARLFMALEAGPGDILSTGEGTFHQFAVVNVGCSARRAIPWPVLGRRTSSDKHPDGQHDQKQNNQQAEYPGLVVEHVHRVDRMD